MGTLSATRGDAKSRQSSLLAGTGQVVSIQPNTAQNIGFVLLLAFMLLAISRFSDFFLSSLHLPLIASSLAMVAAVASGRIRKAMTSRMGLMLTALTLWLFLATPTSIWKGGSFRMLTEGWMKAYIAFFLTACLTATVRQSARLMQISAYATLFVAVLTVPYGVMVDERLSLVRGQYAGANELARTMVIGLVYWWFIAQNPAHSMFHRIGAALAVFPLSFVMLQAGSRAALFSLAALVPFIFFFQSGRGKVFMVLIALVCGAIGVSRVSDTISQRFFTFASAGSERLFNKDERARLEMAAGSAQQRMRLLRISLMLTLTHPIFGVGPGQFEVAENEVSVSEGYPMGSWRGTHNTYTQISSEAGIPALAFFIACLVYCMRELMAVRRLYRGRLDPKSQEVNVVAFALQMVLLAHMVFYCFEHVAYSMSLPILAGLIYAFTSAARAEVTWQPQGLPVPAVPARPAASRNLSRLHPAAQRMFAAKKSPING